jgi:hypothetical protein
VQPGEGAERSGGIGCRRRHRLPPSALSESKGGWSCSLGASGCSAIQLLNRSKTKNFNAARRPRRGDTVLCCAGGRAMQHHAAPDFVPCAIQYDWLSTRWRSGRGHGRQGWVLLRGAGGRAGGRLVSDRTCKIARTNACAHAHRHDSVPERCGRTRFRRDLHDVRAVAAEERARAALGRERGTAGLSVPAQTCGAGPGADVWGIRLILGRKSSLR